MPHAAIDHYARLSSPIHRMPAGAKMIAALLFILITVLIPRHLPILLAPVAGLLLIVAIISSIPASYLLRRMIILEPFVLGVTVLTIFQPGGWRLVLVLAAKCSLCLLTMLLLSNTTPFNELLRVLRSARVPSLIVTTMSLMYRYLFVLVDETHRMKRARQSRTFFRISKRRAWQAAAATAGQLFIRASERAERVYDAMVARGWR